MIGIEIDNIRQLYDVPNKDLIFIIRKPHSKNRVHKPICPTLKIPQDWKKNSNADIPKPIINGKFPRSGDYFHITYDDLKNIDNRSSKKCRICFKVDHADMKK